MQSLETGALSLLLPAVLATATAYAVYTVIYNIYFHPLAKFPGPPLAATSTYWKAYVECDVIRVGPNELHFANPHAYNDIYNSKNRWDKEARLYKSFGEDRSSFGFLTYGESKVRKDVLNRSFSQTAIASAETLVTEQTKALCAAFTRQSQASKSADLYYAYRCLSMDIICTFCFGKPIHAVDAPEFAAPIVVAMDASLPVFIRFKYAEWYKNMIMSCPPKLSRIISPATAGLVDLQQLLKQQINDLTDDPEKLNQLPHNLTIYHRLMDPTAFRDKTVPSSGSLYEEAQALMFGGADTVGNTLMVGTHHLLQRPEVLQTLKKELSTAWPTLSKEPKLRDLESLPYLNAVIKESLRMSSGVVSGLLRVVPLSGATINGIAIPAETIVSCGSTFVHYNTLIFPKPNIFDPERWLDSAELDNWLVAFSRGPRMCLGINLAWAELRLAFAHTIRKFDLSLHRPIIS
ncbi:putative cytochrome P450 [Didymella exigua CBS 183.55]|uniref:Putative cytochrome P450 n=1 Tax=Didymella exigua CBS 183.55 TaxID=1150837 RepID=A0A6A5R837_9PLEO|nr:putative cytochrome P450 [Didymella exigua CBS 183.55]KAF1923479.1 putative cytochrome P450 [Didymella exigua CBS 183.55]